MLPMTTEPPRGSNAKKRVVKARDFGRKPENGGDVDKFAGVPWEPHPGAKQDASWDPK